MRSECGARARSRKPLPGGSGPPLGRHDDRSPRSSVDSRQAKAGNARQAGSQETRELELSQRRMRSPWRVPRRSAERRAARDMSRCRARQRQANGDIRRRGADMEGCAYRRSSSLLREAAFDVRGGSQSSDAQRIARTIFVVRPPPPPATRGERRRPLDAVLSAENADAKHRLWERSDRG
jgi:hypothetical protein